MIKLENVSIGFDGKKVLEDFSLIVQEEEFISIVGASGAGKTTVLNLIGLLVKPQKGSVEIAGICNPNAKQIMRLRRENLGYIFQNFVLLENETVLVNLEISKKYSKDWSENKVIETLETVGLDNSYLKKKIYQLSGGEQQRIAIARCLLKPCQIILADEPTGNLDEANKLAIIEIFKKLKGLGKTIVCVTHDLELAKEADRIIKIG